MVLLLATWQGFRRGLVVELVATVGLLVVLVATVWGLGTVTVWLQPWLPEGFRFLPFVAFLVAFLIGWWGLQILAWGLRGLLRLTLLGLFDAVGGALLGLAKAAATLSLLLWLGAKYGLPMPAADAVLYPQLLYLAPTLLEAFSQYLPFLRGLFEQLRQHFD